MQMPYWVFNNFMVHYSNIKEKEEANSKSDTSTDDMMANQKSYMDSVKRNSMKIPNMNKPKFR